MNETLDVIIVGAGSAGLAALREVRKRTQRFVIINDGPWGTICARVGCMPSKTLIEAANAFHRRGTFEEFGIRGADQLTPDIPAVLRRVRRLRDDFVASTVKTTEELGKRAISGRARLLAPNRLEVNGVELRAHKIIIATGSRPVVPTSWNSLGKRLLTTDTLFEQDTLPARMAVVGMGPIGVEMAQALSRLGIKVAAFSGSQTVAGLTDPQVIAVATDLLGREFPLHLGEKAELSAVSDGVQVHAGSTEVVVDSVLAALGRRPNIDNLGLETLGIPLDQRGMPPVNPSTMQVADLPIFMAGDANDQAPLLHEVADEGYIAGINATRSTSTCFTRRIPLAIVFSDPDIAVVGSRFQALDHAKTLVGEVHFDRQGRARAGQRNKGIQRLYADAGSGRLLGAEMCAPAGEHMAHLLALAIDRSLTVQELLRLPFYHPVLEEGLRTALRTLAAQLPTVSESDLTMCGAFNTEALD
ncbi:dihydrolipoyl dehydrogenase [Nitrosomonas sp. Nm58]|uniref:dihydrolipoyl dehydrogenase n=1 Tax=Nitrosomonas sp. Nm58 TaxID=200126 RepID=UPI0008963161|nr:dihydrolipoyl dehydrogenase [Nitrosomonas sp. Nm58]SDZ08310.1 dihydrolipoamide dehydrogenase [Nitrosomonas sp. Nm58]